MISAWRALVVLACLAWAAPAAAATYYVNCWTGNNGNSGAIGAPWLTVQHATTTMVAGDTTYVRGGTCTENFITFANSGTAGNVITLRGYPGETAIIDAGFTTSSPDTGITPEPVFDIDGPDHITLAYLTIRRGRTTNIFISDDVQSTDITIDHCTLEDFVTGDNAASIYVNSTADNIVISHNLIDGYIPDARSNVASGIIVFSPQDITIEHNEIANVIQGISQKYSATTNYTQLVRYNYLHDITDFGMLWSGHDGIISHNLLYETSTAGAFGAILIFQEAGSCSALASDDNQILHNTIYGGAAGIVLSQSALCDGAINTLVRDNIVAQYDGTEYRGLAISPYRTDDLNSTVTYNLVHSTIVTGTDAFVNTTYYELASLPGTVTHSNNINSAPTFVNAAGLDFTLAAGSAGENAASDGADMGADIACVGIDAPCGGATVPDAPTIGAVTPGNGQCTVAFTPPASDGGAAITGYTATSTPGSFTGTGSASPITVTGLSNGTGYTFTVYATNSQGNSSNSSASNTCTPTAATPGGVRLRLRGNE